MADAPRIRGRATIQIYAGHASVAETCGGTTELISWAVCPLVTGPYGEAGRSRFQRWQTLGGHTGLAGSRRFAMNDAANRRTPGAEQPATTDLVGAFGNSSQRAPGAGIPIRPRVGVTNVVPAAGRRRSNPQGREAEEEAGRESLRCHEHPSKSTRPSQSRSS